MKEGPTGGGGVSRWRRGQQVEEGSAGGGESVNCRGHSFMASAEPLQMSMWLWSL